MELALNNLQWLICHKTKPKQTHTIGAAFQVVEGKPVSTRFFSKKLSQSPNQIFYIQQKTASSKFGIVIQLHHFIEGHHIVLFTDHIRYWQTFTV